MVQIRKLKPSVGPIRLPPREKRPHGWSKVNADARRTERRREDFPPPTPQPTPCVLWQGSIDPDGYGRRKVVRIGATKPQTMGVHRWIVETVLDRRLKTGEVVMHLCDQRLCYRFDHLRIGSIRDNNADRDAKGRLVHVAQRMHGETNGRAKLTKRDAAKIRADFAGGVGVSALAHEHKVARSTIQRIVKGVTWASNANTRDLLAEARQREKEKWLRTDSTDTPSPTQAEEPSTPTTTTPPGFE